ncbi:hypothetical protein MLD38_024501 [Melastoma candidum]|uniref:Uncharacterized protein n=1 Tax=Melastoma candidum TaxID=119954 RepID=A0ACB9NZA3_9MYRT|nr:hypothetical protein MLD38_024501 [Melastoma candidum]
MYLSSDPAFAAPSEDQDAASPSDDPYRPDLAEWDDFGDNEQVRSELELDPGSWWPILEPDDQTLAQSAVDGGDGSNGYFSSVSKIILAASEGDVRGMEEAASEIKAASAEDPYTTSLMGFLYGSGMVKEKNKGKAFLHHYFAAQGGSLQSKMALAYSYMRQEMYDKAVKLYAELAEAAVNSFSITKDSSVVEAVRIHSGAEENKEALRKSRGEDDEDFQILEYQAQKGNAIAMYKVGLFYYFGLRGLRRDYSKALPWFQKAVEKGEPRSMALLGEIYGRGAGVERNYTKAFEWLKLASKQKLYSAYNGIGYLYVKGYGVEKKNYTKAKEYFE